MSLWADYIFESLGKQMLESEKGFITFFILPGTQVCYIEDIYVAPEFRNSSEASTMEKAAINWAQEQKCVEVMGSVSLASKTPERSISYLIESGYKLSSATSSALYFKKNI